MKRFSVLLLVALFATSLLAADKLIKRGAPIAKATPKAELAMVLAKPADYNGKPVVVEGVITASCENKGCWMQLAPKADAAGMRVTFKDYGFFIPTDAKGLKARAEGLTNVKTLSKDEADHLEGEGAKLARNADGTATEVSFVASGVELWK